MKIRYPYIRILTICWWYDIIRCEDDFSHLIAHRISSFGLVGGHAVLDGEAKIQMKVRLRPRPRRASQNHLALRPLISKSTLAFFRDVMFTFIWWDAFEN